MTEYRGEFGQRWDSRLPRDSIKRYVNRQHVYTPFEEIAAVILAACKKNNIPPHMHKACVKYAKAVQDNHRDLCRRFRL